MLRESRKYWFVRTIAVALSFTAARSLAAQSGTPLFRYISIEPFGRIELGDSLDLQSALFVLAAPGYVRLQPKDGGRWQFADTRSILFALTKDRRVCAILFQYLPSKSYTDAVNDYRQSLGPATEQRREVQGSALRTMRWEDDKTTFTFEEILVADQVLLVSRMEDRRFVVNKTCAAE